MSSSDEPIPEPSATPLTEFGDVLVLLARDDVKFLVVGGVAVSLNGFVRSTVDVDILVEGSPDNLQKLLQALGNFGAGYARELQPEDFLFEEGSIRVAETFDIDIFLQMQGRRYEHLAGGALATEFKGQKIPYLSAAQLIELKKGSHREKDQIDVSALGRLLSDQRPTSPAKPMLWDRIHDWLRH